ncbi:MULTISPECIES: energy transducer TonB [unclassified Mesorhizobium]|uniref:cell envelope integrity protein TolA n=1 Tax=unclassified Mesorhizobium TaxID=325217 RepID=UPI000FDC14CB|nr:MULTISPECIES: energy transducer TonB [unclassified Mesorhizobium]TGR38519.1 TonB family protein [bacterium M00.F.Ca.ET.199.01.1.1]TGU27985.1 TonB family protein [bacterium M00.F.Ca.ET.156.01.1.1]TGV10953.1 TonB family protein [Mesorhizobium sp. M8A.F.Ca.ET.173.01.1.1]TGV83514.1 TonB family protein [Mesorhizobium sp. M00.F.Ca.ET.149.01.1.1]TGP98701.1 TonB family protein [Mesorhizobium sp. M8A.F.Ca.ET.218.01.1.1]
MTRSAASPTMGLSRFGWRDLALWACAAVLMLGAHVAVAYAVQNFSPVEPSDSGPPPAPVIEMAPMMMTPAAPEQAAMLDVAIPDQTEPVEETEKTAEPDKVVEQAEPAAELETVPPDEPMEMIEVEPVVQPPLDEVVPDIVEAVAPEVVVPMPRSKPAERRKDKKPAEAKVKRPADKLKPRPKKEKAEPLKTASAASAEARPAAKAAAPSSAAGFSGVSPAKWESRLTAWINRHKRYPSAAKSRRAQGNVNVTFTMDPSGRVLSARVVRSSGDAELDRAALAVLQGATVPAPPPELGSRVIRTAPFVFSLQD